MSPVIRLLRCHAAACKEVVGERWTLLIVRDAFYGVRRFNDFSAHLDAPRTVLSSRLRTLADAGVLERKPDPEHAGRHLYELTESGRGLWPAVYALSLWGAAFATEKSATRRVFTHRGCGEQLDAFARCQACGVTADLRDVVVSMLGEPRPGSRTDPVSLALRRPHRLLDPLPERAAPC